jgi:peptidoglycan/xylan/chitin deacetylase (PgdA/CDA1 family)
MTGTIVFSVDAELRWGAHDLYPLPESQHRRYRNSRKNWMELARLFDAYGVPATWAVVGHLLTDDSAYREEYPYEEGWFEQADRGMVSEPDEWLGQDLIKAVRNATVDNELGSHSFSHTLFSEISEDVAVAECELVRKVMAEHGLEPRSFVFPRNRIGYRSELADHGFDCYRGSRPEAESAVPGLRGLKMLLGGVTGAVAPPTVTPFVDDVGLVNVPASIFLGGFRGSPWQELSKLGTDPAVRLTKRGIDRACDRAELFHVWLHPHDLTDDRYVNRVRDVLDYVAMKKAHGEVRIMTMGEVATQVRNEQSARSSHSEVPDQRTTDSVGHNTQ